MIILLIVLFLMACSFVADLLEILKTVIIDMEPIVWVITYSYIARILLFIGLNILYFA